MVCDDRHLNIAYLPKIPSGYAFLCTIESLKESIDKKVLKIDNKAALDEFITFFESGLTGICTAHGVERNKPKDSNHLQNLSDSHILRQTFSGWNLAHEVVDLELYVRRIIDLLLFIKKKDELLNKDLLPDTIKTLSIFIIFLELLQQHSYKGQMPDSNDDE